MFLRPPEKPQLLAWSDDDAKNQRVANTWCRFQSNNQTGTVFSQAGTMKSITLPIAFKSQVRAVLWGHYRPAYRLAELSSSSQSVGIYAWCCQYCRRAVRCCQACCKLGMLVVVGAYSKAGPCSTLLE